METCDECGPSVGAKNIASLRSGNILTFCQHCTDRHRAKLELGGAFIYPLGLT